MLAYSGWEQATAWRWRSSTPIDHCPTEIETILAFGVRGMHPLISDTVGVERERRTPSECVVGET